MTTQKSNSQQVSFGRNSKSDCHHNLPADALRGFDKDNLKEFLREVESFIKVESFLNPLSQEIKDCIIKNFREISKKYGVGE